MIMIKRILLFTVFALSCSMVYGQGGNGPTGPIPSQTYTQLPAGSGGGGSSSITSATPIPPVPTSGLVLDYQFPPGDNPCASTDASGSGNGSVGCTGTSPLIISNSGGVAFIGAGAITLPAGLTTTVKSWSAYVCWQQSANTSPPYNLIANDGMSGTYGAELQFSGAALTLPFQAGTQIFSKNNNNGSVTFSVLPIVTPQGCFTVTWVYNTHDQIYINALDTTPTNSGFGAGQNAAFISQFTGNFHLGGISGGFWGTGTVKRLLGYTRVITASDAAVISASNAALGTNVGLPPFLSATTSDANAQYVHVGDSESTNLSSSLVTTFAPSILGTPKITNISNSGFLLSTQMAPFVAQECASLFRPAAPFNLCNIYGGTNDSSLTGLQIAGFYQDAAQQVHALTGNGMKFFAVTGISRGTGGIGDTKMAALNTQLDNQWQVMGLDGIVDWGADPLVSPNGSNYSAACLSGDETHPDQDCTYNHEVPIFLQAINHFLGVHDWGDSRLDTYGSASATVATTAGSESTNTITLTITTPANCQANNMVTVAGTTPAGYSGNWLILTRSPTQITYYSRTTGLGVITIQGTAICPQQQDADESYVINFGTGNTTLEDCLGFLNDPRPVRIWNKNATPSTIVPFNSETIAGIATPTTLAGNTIAYLWPVRTSVSAGGCSWLRTQ